MLVRIRVGATSSHIAPLRGTDCGQMIMKFSTPAEAKGEGVAQISMFALIERVGSKEAVGIVHMRSGHSCRSGAALSRARVVVVSWCRSDGVRSARSAQMFALWIKKRERERKTKLTSCLYGEELPPPPPSWSSNNYLYQCSCVVLILVWYRDSVHKKPAFRNYFIFQ